MFDSVEDVCGFDSCRVVCTRIGHSCAVMGGLPQLKQGNFMISSHIVDVDSVDFSFFRYPA